MNILLELIDSMSSHECRHFKLLANRTNQSAKRKDIILFNYFRKHGDKSDEKKIAKKLYGDNLNAFYRLKSRLLGEIKNSLVLNHINKDDDLSVFKPLLMSKLMNSKGNQNLSVEFLIDAEKKAKNKNLPNLLNLVYDKMIKQSYSNNNIDVEVLMKKRKENRKESNRIQEVNDVLGALN